MFCGQATTPDTRKPFKLQPQAICRARHFGFVNCCGLALLLIIPYLLALSMEIKANISIKLKTLAGVREGKLRTRRILIYFF